MDYKIWTSSLIPPEYHIKASFNSPPSFNLKHLGFPFNEIIKFGLKRSVVFYDRYDLASSVYEEPLLAVSWQTIFEDSIPKKQIRRASWVMSDGSWSVPHVSEQPIRNPKVFLQKMRKRVIEELIDLAVNFNLADKLKALYEKYSTEIYIFIEGGSPKFRDAIASSSEESEEWLNLPSTDGRTVRDVIVEYLSIGAV